MSLLVPDLEWYTNKSKNNGSVPRCPFATVNSCPRFYQSLLLLGYAGSTKIEKEEDERLLERWKESSLWPTTREQETSITGSSENYSQFSKFCPEVAFERFGYFATSLGRYADEMDRDHMHKNLGEGETTKNDWRWEWAYVKPQHYSDCSLYSLLVLKHDNSVSSKSAIETPWYQKPLGVVVLGLIVTILGGIIVGLVL